jgi:CDP-diacylglycerol--glycerol-3-phosphate 3-phosphatidyltransferase
MIKYLPNSLTILRIFFIPIFIYFSLNDLEPIALFIFVFACMTDWLDGFIARKYQYISKFGQIMDPLADKVLIITALIILNINPINYLSWVVTLIISLREIAVTILRSYFQHKNIIIPADFWGKIKTVFQMIGIIFCFVFYTFIKLKFLYVPEKFIFGVIVFIKIYFWIIVVITILSGLSYFIRLFKK